MFVNGQHNKVADQVCPSLALSRLGKGHRGLNLMNTKSGRQDSDLGQCRLLAGRLDQPCKIWMWKQRRPEDIRKCAYLEP